ncbi:Nuf2 family-domain-containing protein [Mucidula mucida]|nr:Nuf2 family-domain-containing protein [Mucidula mucida]
MAMEMSPEEIADILKGWGLSTTADSLAKPNADMVETIYWACLTQVTGITRDCLQQPLQSALQASQTVPRDEDKNLYSPALTLHILFYHLNRLIEAAGMEGFSLADIVNPKPTRTIQFLAAVINFVKFTDQFCEPFVQELQKRAEDLLNERDQTTEDLANILDRIATMKAKMAEDEPKCERLREENFILRSKVLAAKELQSSGLQELEKLKAEKTALIKRKELLNDELDSVNDSLMRTRSRIVQSPERIKRTISVMGSTANEDKRTVAIHESKARDLQAKVNALHNIERDVRGCIEQLQTIEKETMSLQASHKELADLRDHRDEKKIEQNELQLRRERVRKQVSNAHEKLERAQRHAEEKRAASQRTIERLQKDYNEMVSERRGNDEQLEKLRLEADAIDVQKNEHLRASEQELNELLAEYWKLRHSIDVYMETLANVLPTHS